MNGRFRDRAHAGRELALRLERYGGRPDVVVMALPRGGVPVAYEVATALGAPLDVLLVRKLGLPGREELAMGAIASGGVVILNHAVVKLAAVPAEMIERVAAREVEELRRRERAYRDHWTPLTVRAKTVIVIDDGLATGSTMRAAVRALRRQQAAKVVVAVPTASPDVCEELAREADDVVCPATPEPFHAVGLWYDDFSQTTDEEVRELLARLRRSEHRAEGMR